MDIQRIAAFCHQGEGGNPAGVVIADTLPPDADMQRIAAEVNYSETAFAAPAGDGFRARYFAPEAEVPFCGHATIALGAALGARFGTGRYRLYLNNGEIEVAAYRDGENWGARLLSPPTAHQAPESGLRDAALALFGWTESDLDPDLQLTRIHGGADHLLIPLARHESLQTMRYAFDTGAQLMQAHRLVTIMLIWRETPALIHARNPFAGHGVYEDPATGAAAAALAGYLRDSGRGAQPFEIHQGFDMGVPSRLIVEPLPKPGAAVQISGTTRLIAA